VTRTPRGLNRASNCAAVGRDRTVVAASRDRWGQLDQSVDGDHTAVGLHDQRVDVDAGDVGAVGAQAAETDEQLGELAPIDRCLAAERSEELLGREVVDHVAGGDGIDRRRPEHDVGDRFGEDAADAEHHRRSELGITDQPGDQLAVAGDHRCDEHRDLPVLRTRCREQLGGGGLDGGTIAEAELDETAFGLVGDRVAVQLGDDRIAELVGGGGSGGGAVGHALGGDRDAVLGEQGLGGPLGQGGVRAGRLGGGRWGRHAAATVPVGTCRGAVRPWSRPRRRAPATRCRSARSGR
jgi:hypothetical protein